MKPNFLFLLFSILLLSTNVKGQFSDPSNTSNEENSTKSFFDNVTIGGGLGLQFGDVTIIDVSPRIGYTVDDKWIFGLSSKYQYISIKSDFEDFETNTYGGGVYSSYLITEELFLHAEYEVLNGKWIYNRDRFDVESFFIGGGYRFSLGSRAHTSLMLLYNINQSDFSPYNNPVMRVNFGFNL